MNPPLRCQRSDRVNPLGVNEQVPAEIRGHQLHELGQAIRRSAPQDICIRTQSLGRIARKTQGYEVAGIVRATLRVRNDAMRLRPPLRVHCSATISTAVAIAFPESVLHVAGQFGRHAFLLV